MNLFSFFFPKKITEVNSPINGKIEVVEQFGRQSIKVGGMEQSGPMVEKIWEKGIKNLAIINHQSSIINILFLGLGGGSAIKVINKYFPQANILGIEIDPVMIKLGKKYLSLSEYKNLEIKICDAFQWLRGFKLSGLNHLTKFDLILVDLYLGRKVPWEMENEKFLNNVKGLLTNKGTVIFNRLRGKGERQFLDKLEKVYHDVKVVKPVVNYLVICR